MASHDPAPQLDDLEAQIDTSVRIPEEEKGRHPWKMPPFSLRKINKTLSAVLSFVTRTTLILLILFGVAFIYRQLSGSNYSIEQVTVPKGLEEAGYTGQVVANRMFNRVNTIVKSERLADVANEYQNANSVVDLNVEVVGIGVPIRSITTMLGDALGIHNRKSISGNMAIDGDTLVLELNINGEVEKFQTAFDNNIERAMAVLIERSAEAILMHTSPYVLARHYLLRDSEGAFRLGRYILNKHENNPDVEPIGFFAVAAGYYTESDFVAAERVIRAGIAKYSDDLNLHAALSTMLHRQLRYDEALAQCKKIISMLDDNTPINRVSRSYLNLSFIMGDLQKLDSALYYAEQARDADKDFIEAYVYIGELSIFGNDTLQAIEHWTTAFEKGLRVSDYRRMMRSHPKLMEDPRVKAMMTRAQRDY